MFLHRFCFGHEATSAINKESYYNITKKLPDIVVCLCIFSSIFLFLIQ